MLFATLLEWRVFAKLEGGAVDSIVCPQSGGKNEADHKRRTASHLQKLGKYVRRVGPEVRAKELAYFGFRQFTKVLGQLLPCIAPGEKRVGLRKSDLPETIHHLDTA